MMKSRAGACVQQPKKNNNREDDLKDENSIVFLETRCQVGGLADPKKNEQDTAQDSRSQYETATLLQALEEDWH